MSFRDVLFSGTVEEKLRTIEMRMLFARLCLDQPTRLTSEYVYNALSHLALIRELDIDLRMYEQLRMPPDKDRLDTDAYVYANCKLAEARSLRNNILEVNYAFD